MSAELSWVVASNREPNRATQTMAIFYALARKGWRKLPLAARSLIQSCWPLEAVKQFIRNLTVCRASHDDVYDSVYYEMVEQTARRSADSIAELIVTCFSPSSVLDVGCATGALLTSLRSRKVEGKGLEYSEAALSICRSRGLDVRKFDLEKDELVDAAAVDLVVSMEVAEHLPEYCADRYLDLLCGASDTIVFTAATPGQGGNDHVNEQPHGYWIKKFEKRGFQFDQVLSLRWRAKLKESGAARWYHKNLMIFKRYR